ncbi:fimbrial protein [Erwinia sorbitola]|uniref:Fimbrial-type adhesion domain-containing protein n=1 Tax=Erwinia sorbitola TaxID=2681984 RepID=A0A6I6EJQ0_9GAMM|nr:fimbrial protein [Erwinia sorbitola]QGU86821.1 hypothetical protein GN242_06185 [Erwinia sorbitola]
MKNRKVLLSGVVVLALSCLSLNTAASSLKCIPDIRDPFPLVTFNGSNGIKLSASLPIGRTVFNQTFTINVLCSISDPLQQEDEVAFFVRQTSTQTLGNGLTLYTTINGDRGSEYSVVNTGITINNHNAARQMPPRTWQRFSLDVAVEIVKTAKTPSRPEQVTPIKPRIELFRIGAESGVKSAKFVMLDATSGLTFIAHSCRIQGPSSFSVALGPVRIRSGGGLGSGIGSVNKGQAFALNFLCDTDVSGDFNVMMQLAGTRPADATTPGLIALSKETNTASGIALQILHATSTLPVEIGKRWQIASYPLTSGVVTVSLRARYYQTEKRITAGKANGIVTWTLHYM